MDVRKFSESQPSRDEATGSSAIAILTRSEASLRRRMLEKVKHTLRRSGIICKTVKRGGPDIVACVSCRPPRPPIHPSSPTVLINSCWEFSGLRCLGPLSVCRHTCDSPLPNNQSSSLKLDKGDQKAYPTCQNSNHLDGLYLPLFHLYEHKVCPLSMLQSSLDLHHVATQLGQYTVSFPPSITPSAIYCSQPDRTAPALFFLQRGWCLGNVR